MKIEIEHPSVYKLTKEQWNFLLDGTIKLSTFLNRAETLLADISKNNPFLNIAKLDGDIYEIFVEAFIRMHPMYFSNYHPNDILDYGVDGDGIGANGLPFAQQSKKRPWDYLLTYNDERIANFIVQAEHDFNVDLRTKSNLIIFTTGAGLHYSIKNGIPSIRPHSIQINCWNRKAQSDRVDNNHIFWNSFRESINDKF